MSTLDLPGLQVIAPTNEIVQPSYSDKKRKELLHPGESSERVWQVQELLDPFNASISSPCKPVTEY